MVIKIDEYRIAYFALPKAGCTTVKVTLSGIDPDFADKRDSLAPDDRAEIHAVYPTRRYRPVRWREVSDDWWRFCVVRDPAERILSCYTDRVLGRQELRNSRRLRGPNVDLPTDPDPDFFFQNLREYVRLSSVIKHHALSCTLFLGPRMAAFDRVYRLEDLGLLAQDLSARTGRSLSIPHNNKSAASLTLGDLAPASRDSLRRYLGPDYEVLSDYYENPLI